MTDQTTTLQQLKKIVMDFRHKRNWDKEDPKDIAIGLSLEANEVLDIFQWRSLEEIISKPHAIEGIADELADVMFYLCMMGNRLNLDLAKAFEQKIAKNEIKYPADAFSKNKTSEEKRRTYYRIKAKYRSGHPLAEEDREE